MCKVGGGGGVAQSTGVLVVLVFKLSLAFQEFELGIIVQWSNYIFFKMAKTRSLDSFNWGVAASPVPLSVCGLGFLPAILNDTLWSAKVDSKSLIPLENYV